MLTMVVEVGFEEGTTPEQARRWARGLPGERDRFPRVVFTREYGMGETEEVRDGRGLPPADEVRGPDAGAATGDAGGSPGPVTDTGPGREGDHAQDQ